MRIVHVIGSLDPAAGGPPAIMLNMAAAQAARGHEVVALGGWDPEREDVVRSHWSGVSGLDKLDLARIPSGGRLADALGSPVVPELERRAPFDAMHVHSVWDPVVRRATAWARARRLPYACLINGMLDVWSMEQNALKKRVALALGYRRMLAGAAFLQAGNQYEKDILLRYGFGSPIEIIPNGVFVEDIERPTEPDQFRRAHPELGDRPFVLFLSRLHYKKGLDILADAWRLVAPEAPGTALVVAGPRDDDVMDTFWSRIDDAGLRDTALEVGPVYGDDKLAAFRECACFTLPSRQEGFSVAITEALGLGVPVVATRDCHYSLITEHEAGIETSLDAGEVAAGIRRMLEDEPFRESRRRNGAALVREQLTWPRVAEMTERLYEAARA